MANKELDKLRSMSVSDLNKSLEAIYKEQFEDNLKLKTGQLNEVHKIRLNKKQVARIKTVISEKNNAGEENGCLLYTSPSPRDRQKSRMPSSA